MLFNITRKNKITGKWQFLPHNSHGLQWEDFGSSITRKIMRESNADFLRSQCEIERSNEYYYFKTLNQIRQTTCKICNFGDYTGNNGDLDFNIHKGFTIGRGKTMYWMMIWHRSGHVTVFSANENTSRRWIDGGTEITIHFQP